MDHTDTDLRQRIERGGPFYRADAGCPLHPMPDQHEVVSLKWRFTRAQMERIQRGCYPTGDTWRWFIIFENDALFCWRAWSGYMPYALKFAGCRAVEAVLNRDAEQYRGGDVREVLRSLRALIQTHLIDPHSPYDQWPFTIVPDSALTPRQLEVASELREEHNLPRTLVA